MLRAMTAGAFCLMLAACGDGGAGNEAGDRGNAAAAARPAAPAEGRATRSLLDSLAASPDHATLVNAIKAAGLTETLSGAQPYTLFAPTEAAFAKLPAGTVDGLLAPDARGQLTALLTSHIVPGTVTAEDLARAIERGKGKAQLATVGGANLAFAKDGDAIVATDSRGGRARVTGGTAASNGVVHPIDAVLMPQ